MLFQHILDVEINNEERELWWLQKKRMSFKMMTALQSSLMVTLHINTSH